MWAAGVVDLGLAPAAFWSLTPREFARLFDRHLDREERADRRAGLVAHILANAHRDTKTRPHPFTIDDFVPSRHARKDLVTRMREELDPERAAARYVEALRMADPQAEITISRAVLESVAAGRGEWSKLGTREGLMEPASVQAVMAGKRPS